MVPAAPPMTMPSTISSKLTTEVSASVVATAMTMPTMPKILPWRAVSGDDSPLSAKMNNTRVEELKGMKMRFFGLGARVMSRLGVSTQLIAGGDIFPALEKGVIDATEFSMPTMDLSYGFYQVAKYNYFPGWHQQSTASELLMNKNKWEDLSSTAQALIRTTCNDAYLWSAIKSDADQPDAMAQLQSKGVTFVTWEDSELAKFKKAWEEEVAESSAADPLFAEVHKSYSDFRKKYAIWGDRAYLK